MDKNNDCELVEKCIEEDAEAWSEFVDRFSGLIYWVIKRKLNKYDCTYLMSEAEDIYQRLFASIWRKKSLANIRERDNIAPWLIVLASNATIDFIRKRRFEEDFLRGSLESESAPRNEKADIFLRENKRLLNEAIKVLNEKEKAYLESNYIAGKKHKEIAEIFNTSINTVSSVIARAKDRIKKYIEWKK